MTKSRPQCKSRLEPLALLTHTPSRTTPLTRSNCFRHPFTNLEKCLRRPGHLHCSRGEKWHLEVVLLPFLQIYLSTSQEIQKSRQSATARTRLARHWYWSGPIHRTPTWDRASQATHLRWKRHGQAAEANKDRKERQTEKESTWSSTFAS